jgi:NADH-quinone oxidoreductase subunit F
MKVRTLSDLEQLRATGLATLYPPQLKISVGLATCGRAAGAGAVYDTLGDELSARGLEASLVAVGCVGYCQQEPLVDVRLAGKGRALYARMTPEGAKELVGHLADGRLPTEGALAAVREKDSPDGDLPPPMTGLPLLEELPFYARQVKIVLRNSGFIDPARIEEYIARGGYQALARVLGDFTPLEVVEEIRHSGLRGRGGGGFPTGRKWQVCRDAPGQPKYIICNGDEGDPGAYMDRTILEGDPHSVIEGMIIGAYAIGSNEGYLYIRNEYPLAVKHMAQAIARAEELGLLGEDILGSGFDFRLKLVRGAGAFVCGEETALIASIEGGLGEPRSKPPYPATSGLWGKPTVINNVKTWATVPVIIARGADWYAGIGAKDNAGTVVFSLVGKVKNTGLVEVPLGLTLGELLADIGGGGLDGKAIKAVQTGGPSGGCIPASMFNMPIEYEAMTRAGSIMGSGGMVVLDEDTCMVDLARYFMSFVQEESCGKCVPCRLGTKAMLATIERICAGQGRPGDVEYLEELAREIKVSSLCGLGQTAPNPVLTTIRYFRDEYEAHIREQRCSAGACLALVRARCANACPAGVDVPSYIALVAQGRYTEALEIHRRRNPFALVCGRVCPAFCESRCRRAELDQAIAIRQIKRFMADHELEQPWTPPRLEEPKAEKVAVIGAGPAGLTAALRLAQKGYPVTVFEALPVAGGMMAVGIPEYRLPRRILNAEIENIQRAGVEIRLNTALGRDFTINDLMDRDGYKAVILAIGAHKNRELDIAGEDMQGVYPGTQFLRDIALGRAPDLTGKRVAVIGGGDVAIDAARSAWRLGASQVYLVYRRSQADMPARSDEVAAAEKEGVQFLFLTAPSRVLGNGRVTAVELLRQELGEFDVSGRRHPIPIAGSEFTLDVDALIPAVGQEPDLTCITGDSTIETGPGATFVVRDGLATTREGVFAAGDAVSGPATLVEAVAQGNRVADTVDNYLRTGNTELVAIKPGYEVVEQQYDLEQYAEATRPQIRELDIERRRGNFKEVELPLDEKTVQEECKRCLRCDLEWLEAMGLDFTPVLEQVAGRRSE